MGGQGKRVRIAVTPRCEIERASAWHLPGAGVLGPYGMRGMT